MRTLPDSAVSRLNRLRDCPNVIVTLVVMSCRSELPPQRKSRQYSGLETEIKSNRTGKLLGAQVNRTKMEPYLGGKNLADPQFKSRKGL